MTADRRSVALVFPGCHRRGGVERVVREHGRRLAATHDVTFVGEEMDPEGMDAVAFLPVAPSGASLADRLVPDALRFRRAAGEVLRAHPFDVVISFGANCPPGDIQVVQSVHRAWLRSSAPIPTRIGTVPPAARYAMPQHLALLALERSYFGSDRPVVVAPCSDRTGTEVIELYGVSPEKVHTLTNGFDPDEFGPAVRGREREGARRRAGIAPDDVAILFVANELHRKGFATLVDALARRRDPRLHVHVVGRVDGAAYLGPIAEAGLTDHVHWHGPQGDVAPWYAAADLFVLPTQYEPFGNVIVEALAMGVPVITTEVAGASSAVIPGTNGYLQHRPTDADELADLIGRAVEPEALGRLTQAADEGLDRFAWDVLTRRLDGMIGDVPRRP